MAAGAEPARPLRGGGRIARQRGGRAKRYFAAERSGVEALAQSQALLTGLWDGIELDPERYG